MSKVKRTSLLLEILLALTLVVLFIAPLVKAPIEAYKQQMSALKEGEKQRLADLSFAEIKVQLLNHQIPWKQIPGKKDPPKIIDLPDAILQVPYCNNVPIKRRAVLKCAREKLSVQGDILRLIKIEIEFEPFIASKKGAIRYAYQAVLTKSVSN